MKYFSSGCFISIKGLNCYAWRDENADGDFTPVGPGAVMAPEVKADVRGAIYGQSRLFQGK